MGLQDQASSVEKRGEASWNVTHAMKIGLQRETELRALISMEKSEKSQIIDWQPRCYRYNDLNDGTFALVKANIFISKERFSSSKSLLEFSTDFAR